ncbi:peptidase inhibitor family I36 protein [Streptomyces pseudovenezuelae]|uniref:peptidase inhibitor family I36 protein n=1 Tax=Streptomyces pseudovenezuelae TaxID=67350 RepID=UPI0036E49C8A
MTENRGGSRRTWVSSTVAVTTGFSAILAMASTADAATQSAATAANTCPYTYFCAYPEPNFGGTPIAVTDCIEKYIPWTSLGSWINHQTPGTRAQFRSSDHVTRWTDDGAYDSDASADWSWVYWVKPC